MDKTQIRGLVFMGVTSVVFLVGGGALALFSRAEAAPWPGLAFAGIGLLSGIVGIAAFRSLRALSREPALLHPGRVVRFRSRRTFSFILFLSFLGVTLPVGILVPGLLWGWGDRGVVASVAVVLGAQTAFVAWVSRKLAEPGWGRTYRADADGLVIEDDEGTRAFSWDEVDLVRHYPPANSATLTTVTSYDERLEVHFRTGAPLIITRVRRQPALSRLIVDHTRRPVVNRLLADFDRDGQVDFGDLRLTRDGVSGPSAIGRSSDRFVPWRAAWQLTQYPDQEGSILILTTPKVRIRARVPEYHTARDLLTAVARSYAE